MRKKIAMALLTAAFCAVSSMTAFAMPEQMPDGGVFDAEYYAEENPDVVAVMGNGKDALYQHYTLAGKNEGRLPGVAFDAEYYAANNPDVAAVLGTEEDVLYQHYRLCGKSEGRLPSAPGTALKPLKSSAQTTPATPANPAAQPQAGGIPGTFGETYIITTAAGFEDCKMIQAPVTVKMVDGIVFGGVIDVPSGYRARYAYIISEWMTEKEGVYVASKWSEGAMCPAYFYDFEVERSENWTDDWKFTVTQDGVVYPECMAGGSSDITDVCAYVILPQNYDGTVLLKVYASKPDENSKPVKDEQNYIYYVIK